MLQSNKNRSEIYTLSYQSVIPLLENIFTFYIHRISDGNIFAKAKFISSYQN